MVPNGRVKELALAKNRLEAPAKAGTEKTKNRYNKM